MKIENQKVANLKDEGEKQIEVKEKEPVLKASFLKDGKTLKIRYELTNESSGNIYTFNVMWDVNQEGREVLAKEQVYVSLVDDSLVSFSKRIPPLPLIRTVEFRYVPYATKVKPGKKFEEELVLNIPVEEYNYYFPKEESSETEIRLAENATFSVDYIFEVEDLEVKETEIKDAFSIWHPKLMALVRTVKSKPASVSIEVIYRKDEFERF